MNFQNECNKLKFKMERSVKDISDDMKPFLDSLFNMLTENKVPRKAKCKL